MGTLEEITDFSNSNFPSNAKKTRIDKLAKTQQLIQNHVHIIIAIINNNCNIKLFSPKIANII